MDKPLILKYLMDYIDNSCLPATESICALTQLLTCSPDWVASLVPVRGGVIITLKKIQIRHS